MESSGALTSWDAFTKALETRFGPTACDDPVKNLTKLHHMTSVEDYQTQFEILANSTEGPPEGFMISCFLSGVKDNIRLSVKMFKPSTLSATFGLARIPEDKGIISSQLFSCFAIFPPNTQFQDDLQREDPDSDVCGSWSSENSLNFNQGSSSSSKAPEVAKVFFSGFRFQGLDLQTSEKALKLVGEPLKAALLINYDPSGPSRLMSVILFSIHPLDERGFDSNLLPSHFHHDPSFLGVRSASMTEGLKLSWMNPSKKLFNLPL
ncbi:hypothetical protein HHK36_028351 [Tetracentron sinense]|uniref:Retrotransposon gag domain-containing protein n=1 Tax=Tetracentron sinense TaxID=13715 RepID=A0A834YEY4_TETSI|nr:hypothetical protein HHK36_028351 [Tetracentron sinense]